MSLLTDTMGTPERVWSAMSAVTAADGLLGRDELQALLNPKFVRNGQEREPTDVAPKQTIGSTVSLGLIRLENGSYRLGVEAASDFTAFTDRVHARLCSIDAGDADYLVLETYAWMLLEIDKRQSLHWTAQTAATFANAAENDIGNPRRLAASPSRLDVAYNQPGEQMGLARAGRTENEAGSGLSQPVPGGDLSLSERILFACRQLRNREGVERLKPDVRVRGAARELGRFAQEADQIVTDAHGRPRLERKAAALAVFMSPKAWSICQPPSGVSRRSACIVGPR